MFRPEVFLYRSKDTILHRLDPRSKFYYAFVMFVLAIIITDFIFLFILFLITFIPIIVGKIFKQTLRAFQSSLIFIALIFIINYIFSLNLFLTLALVLRFLILITSFLTFSLTTSIDEIALSLYSLKFPYDFVLALTLAYRFIPTLFKDAVNVLDSQRSRGLETQKGNIIRRIRNFLPIIIPLLAIAIRRALNVAEAMESKCFGASKRPTSYYELKIKTQDMILIGISSVIFAMGILKFLGAFTF
jgi:energy-coupling factor transport system permease protein